MRLWRRRKGEQTVSTPTHTPATLQEQQEAFELRRRADRAKRRASEQGQALGELSDTFTSEMRRALQGR